MASRCKPRRSRRRCVPVPPEPTAPAASGTTAVAASRWRMPRRATLMRWRIVAASFMVLAVGGLISNSFALFLVAVPETYHWSRSATTLAYGVYSLTSALSAPVIGWAAASRDSRIAFIALSVVSGVGMLGCALMSSVYQFWLFFGVLGGLGAHGFSSFALFMVIGSRISKGAATAMSTADAGAGLALFLGLPALHALIVAEGWRAGFLLLAALSFVIGIAFHIRLPVVRRRVVSPQATAARWRPARLWPLAVMAACFFCGPAAYQALQTQQIALLEGSGVVPETAVWVASTIGGTVFVWRVLSGVLCDRLGPRVMMAIAGTGAAASLAALGVFMAIGLGGLLVIYPIGLAVGFGSQAMLMAMGLRGVVPRGAYAQTFGIMRSSFGAGAFVGPVAAAAIYDATGSYAMAVLVISAFAVIHFAGFALATGRRAIAGNLAAA